MINLSIVSEKIKTLTGKYKPYFNKFVVFLNQSKIFNILKSWLDKYKSFDRKKRVFIVTVIVFVGVLLWAFLSAIIITTNFNRSQISGEENKQKVVADGIIITETKEGKKYFEIYGETGNYNNDDNIATLNNVVGNFYKDNEVAMSFQSSKGSYNEKLGTITLYQNTYIVLKDETSLATDKLTWYGNGKQTIAEGNVKIKKSNEMLALADKCIISPDYDNFKIVGKTQTKIYGDK